MGFKLNPNKPDTWMVWYSKRHPITRKPVQLRRTGIKSKAEAKKAEVQLIIEVENKVKRKVVPSWSKLIEDYRQRMSWKRASLRKQPKVTTCACALILLKIGVTVLWIRLQVRRYESS